MSALVLESCIRLGIAMLEMSIGFEDLTAAYRFMATSQSQFTVFCVWRFSDGNKAPLAPLSTTCLATTLA